MEKRKDNYTSRERINDSLLLEILNESEGTCNRSNTASNASCGSNSARNRGSSCNASARRSNVCDRSSRYDRVSEKYLQNMRAQNCRSSEASQDCGEKTRRSGYANAMPGSCNYNDDYYLLRREEQVESNGCGCDESCVSSSCINKYPYAMVYSPDHDFCDIYSCEEALERGTLFRALDLVFYPTRSCNCR